MLEPERLNLALVRRHVNSKAAPDDGLLIQRVRNTKARFNIFSIGGPGRTIAAIHISVTANHSEFIRRQEEVGRIRVVRCGVSCARRGVDCRRCRQIEAALNPIEALTQATFQFVSQTKV